MSIQNWSDEIVVVDLPREPQLYDELQVVIDSISYDLQSNVVLDFNEVEMLTSSAIAKLLRLRKILVEHDKEMIICNLKPRTLNIFRLTGLIDVFKLSQDKLTALTSLQMSQKA